VRSRAPLAVRDVIHAVAQVDPTEAVANFSPMAKLVAESVAPSQFVAILMIVFAGLAVLLAAIGLYGVLSCSVAGRIHEIGLRMALGATRWDVLRMVLGEGAKMAFLGVAIGLLAAFGLTRLLTAMLFGIGPRDPGTFAAIAILLILVALAASYMPARPRRATKVDPMVALRSE
jgi:putative ABC transport system permease protein